MRKRAVSERRRGFRPTAGIAEREGQLVDRRAVEFCLKIRSDDDFAGSLSVALHWQPSRPHYFTAEVGRGPSGRLGRMDGCG